VVKRVRRPVDEEDDDDTEEVVRKKKKRPVEEEDEDEDEAPVRRRKKKVVEEDDEEEEDDEDADDDEDEEEAPVRKRKKKVVEEDDDDDDDDEDEKEEKPVRKRKNKVVEDDDEEEDDEDSDDDDEELAKAAKEESANENVTGGSGQRISTKDGSYTFGDDDLGSEMDCIVVRAVQFMQYFTSSYNKKNPQPPDCFALSVDGKNMKPHENSSEPQARKCDVCPHSKVVDGNPPDCATKRRIALLHVDDIETPKMVAKAAMPYLEIPWTSIKQSWSPYIKKVLPGKEKPSYAVLTHLELDDKKVTRFSYVKKLPSDIVAAVVKRREEALDTLMTPFQPKADEDEDDTKPKKKKKRVVEEDDDDDEPPVRKRKKKVVEDDDEKDEDDEADDEEDEAPVRKRKKKVVEDDDEDDEEDEDDTPPVKKKKSRFSR
jgi:hypothetical protein